MNSAQPGSHHKRDDCRHQDVGTGLQEKLDEADSRGRTHDDVGNRTDQGQQAADIGQESFDQEETEQFVAAVQFFQGDDRQRADDDHRRDVVQHRREDHRHQAVGDEQFLRIPSGSLGDLDGNPREQTGFAGDVHKQARAEDDGNDPPIDSRNVDRHADGMTTRKQRLPVLHQFAAAHQHFLERQDVKHGPQQQADGGGQSGDDGFFGV